jgi:hypothetical protein
MSDGRVQDRRLDGASVAGESGQCLLTRAVRGIAPNARTERRHQVGGGAPERHDGAAGLGRFTADGELGVVDPRMSKPVVARDREREDRRFEDACGGLRHVGRRPLEWWGLG